MKYTYSIVCAILILYVTNFQAVSGLEPSPTLRVGIYNTPPFCFTGPDGEALGIYPDLINKIASKEHWKVTFTSSSWSEGLEQLQREEIDLIAHIGFSEKRQRTMDFNHESVFDEWGQIFLKPGTSIESIQDLEGLHVAVEENDMNGHNFIRTTESMGVHCNIVIMPTREDVFRAVQAGTVAAGVTSQHFGLRHARDFKLVASSIQFSPFSLFFASKKGFHGDKLTVIDTYLHRWKQVYNSYYHERLFYWMGANAAYEKTVIPRWLTNTVGAIIIISALLAALSRALNNKVKKKTRELRSQKKQYKDLVENANSIILRMDKSGRVLFLNRFGLDLFGYTRDEIYGRNILDMILSPETAQSYHFITADKKTFKLPEDYEFMENENICKDGRTVSIQWSNRAINDHQGHFHEILCIGTDITQRRQLEASLSHAQKIEAIGTLAGGIAHDFNNILTIIFGYTDLARLYLDKPDKIKDALDQISKGGLRAKELISQILTFSRRSESKQQTLQPLHIVKETITLLRPALPSTIKIESVLASKSTIHADPTQIHQIIMNLCTNAYHAMEKNGGTLRVALTDTHIRDNETGAAQSPSKPGDYILLEVSDTGCGIDPEIIEKIFDPYFTTKERGKGTGLGLSVVHGIVKDHKGHIHAQSLPGKGTTFRVYLPVLKHDISSAPKDISREPITGGDETILVVDDEIKITESLSQILSRHGYTVKAFTDAAKAIEFFQDAPDTVDLILTDMTMPGMRGSELTREILRCRPKLPVILCSGDIEPLSVEYLQESGIADYIQKPIMMGNLLQKIRKQLDG
ncbi:ATP-binding protein [Desulfoluna spongiiphila]|uniref:histidine kinase n=1 Tax=Desulfoluna spongiiphila TaxID=419481 RepID=A0A1G5DVT4_9BACT|nr:ATP-binding protein [Desulfoluna spongiiphila]SCY18755.1 PAS domain S-box-containing protein [Desulfoluna spongiiphila]